MQTINESSKGKKIGGWIISGLVILFLLFDALMKFVQPEEVKQASIELGLPADSISTVGGILLVSTILYAIPRLSFIGAILLTGYLGGAVATHFRLGQPIFSHTLFPVYIGILVWIGLALRNRLVRDLIGRV